mgnify:FL=1
MYDLYYKYGLPEGYSGSTEKMKNSGVCLYYILKYHLD